MQIGPHTLANNLILAPMAGITDRPFREICRRHGAGLAVSEMFSANPDLRDNRRTRLKADHTGEATPRAVQIVDINMGGPAKKVCAVDIPVTLKIRSGWDRTRACGFTGEAEYETIRRVKRAVNIPVIANGDIDSPQKAKCVLQFTGADAIMIDRVAQGRPWIFQEFEHYLHGGGEIPPPAPQDVHTVMINHLERLYLFYGNTMGVRIARKHIGWYLKKNSGGDPWTCSHKSTRRKAQRRKKHS